MKKLNSRKMMLLGLATMTMVTLAGASNARANCAATWYDASVAKDKVTIGAPWGNTGGRANKVLRQNIDTKETVVLASDCVVPGDREDELVCTDECVAKGRYRYGLQVPLACGCGSRPLYREIVVEESIETACQEDRGKHQGYTGVLEWGDESSSSKDCPGGRLLGCNAVSDRGLIFGANGLAALLGVIWLARRRLARR
jgi:hypothetical protein